MALYNLSEFITAVKENIGIQDLPLPVTDQQIIEHFDNVTLKDFSVCYPRTETFLMGNDNLEKPINASRYSYYEYRIPKWIYDGTCVLDVTDVDVARPNGYNDLFVPSMSWSGPDAIIGAMADFRLAAGVASAVTKALTWKFTEPNRLYVYNGWAGGTYEVEVLLKHDLSLATVPEGAIYNLRLLAEMDLEVYLYNKLKRKEGLETGLGSIQLKVDDWSNVKSEREELVKEWRGNVPIDFSHIRRW